MAAGTAAHLKPMFEADSHSSQAVAYITKKDKSNSDRDDLFAALMLLRPQCAACWHACRSCSSGWDVICLRQLYIYDIASLWHHFTLPHEQFR